MKATHTHRPARRSNLFVSFALIASAILLTTTLTGCAHLRRGAAAALMPPDQEIALGAQLSEEMEKELQLHPNPEVQAYVSAMGARILRAAAGDRHRGMSFTFKVVDDPETINAFALPGGWIYIYSGLLLAAETEAEIASVLAHEIAHVTRRHIAERLATNYGLQVLAAVALGEDPSTLKQMATNIAGTGYLLHFSRDQEVDADVTGVKYVSRAGWNPNGFVDFFKKIGGDREAGSRRVIAWLSTHPMPEDRIVTVNEAIASLSSVPSFDGREQYQRFLPKVGVGSSGGAATKSGTSAPDSTTGTESRSPSTTTPPPSGGQDAATPSRDRRPGTTSPRR